MLVKVTYPVTLESGDVLFSKSLKVHPTRPSKQLPCLHLNPKVNNSHAHCATESGFELAQMGTGESCSRSEWKKHVFCDRCLLRIIHFNKTTDRLNSAVCLAHWPQAESTHTLSLYIILNKQLSNLIMYPGWTCHLHRFP